MASTGCSFETAKREGTALLFEKPETTPNASRERDLGSDQLQSFLDRRHHNT